MINDPYTLIVALDVNASAQGTLYIDDGESFDYRSGKYIYIEFDYRVGNIFRV
jgi:alpha 1,3-glucosidase